MLPTIRTAEVKERTSSNGAGTFLALVDDDKNGKLRIINYVSPYASKDKAGMVAIPEVGTVILVCKPTGSQRWFYLGSTFESESVPPDNEVEGGSPIAADLDKAVAPIERVAPELYSVGNVPGQVVLKGPYGQGLEITSQSDGETLVNVTTKLMSEGKGIEIKDSPGQDSVSLQTGNNASITLTSDPKNNPDKPASTIQIESTGPLSQVCKASDLDIRVLGDGKELNLINKANGTYWGNFQHANPINPCGNVNVQSDWGDVNILSKSPLTGRIFIETVNSQGTTQLIQLATNGPDGSIVLKGTRILLDALETIEMQAGEGVYINTTKLNVNTINGMNLESTTGDIKIEPGAGNVDLAPGVPGAEPPPNIPLRTRGPENLSDYAFRGVE